MITLDDWEYEIIKDFRDGFLEEALLARYSDVLLKYDYIQDYLYEYCNFGCAHFVLKKVGKVKKVEVPEEPEILETLELPLEKE